MANDVKNNAGGDTGNVQNGKTCILTSRAGTLAMRTQYLDSIGFSEFSIAGFDTSPPGCILDDRFDDPRYYTGDAIT